MAVAAEPPIALSVPRHSAGNRARQSLATPGALMISGDDVKPSAFLGLAEPPDRLENSDFSAHLTLQLNARTALPTSAPRVLWMTSTPKFAAVRPSA
jgi:hypothetical protein